MSNWLMSVWESFEKAFLVSDRYSAYLDGFKTTLIISFFAVLLGVARDAPDGNGYMPDRKTR